MICSVAVCLRPRAATRFVRRRYFRGRAFAARLGVCLPRLRGGAVLGHEISARLALEFLVDRGTSLFGGHHARSRESVQKNLFGKLLAVAGFAIAARLGLGLENFRSSAVAGHARAARAPLFHKHGRFPGTVRFLACAARLGCLYENRRVSLAVCGVAIAANGWRHLRVQQLCLCVARWIRFALSFFKIFIHAAVARPKLATLPRVFKEHLSLFAVFRRERPALAFFE